MGKNAQLELEIEEITQMLDKINSGFTIAFRAVSSQSKLINRRRKFIWEQFKNIF